MQLDDETLKRKLEARAWVLVDAHQRLEQAGKDSYLQDQIFFKFASATTEALRMLDAMPDEELLIILLRDLGVAGQPPDDVLPALFEPCHSTVTQPAGNPYPGLQSQHIC